VTRVAVVELPAPAEAATAEGSTVWCLARGHLLRLAAGGAAADVHRVEISGDAVSVAAAGGILAVATAAGSVIWLDQLTGAALGEHALGGPVELFGGDHLWALDRPGGRALRLAPGDGVETVVVARGVDRFAAGGDRAWWTAHDDSLLRNGEGAVDLGVRAEERGAIVVCAGAVWVSVAGGLVLVNAWSGAVQARLEALEGPVPFLVCVGGAVVGTSGRSGLFVLDPQADADARHLDVHLHGRPAAVTATIDTVWAFPAHEPVALAIPVR
jgi:hypothetical protein